MRTRFLAASIATLFAHTMATAAPPPPLMAPTGPWNVEFADSMCLLGRAYGKTNLVLKPAMLGDNLEIIVAQTTNSIAGPEDGKAVLTVEGKTMVGDAFFTAYSTAKLRVNRIWIKDDLLSLAAVRGTLLIDAKQESRHLFSVAGIERALPVLSGCVDQLRAVYKVGKADLAAIVTWPENRIVGLFSSYDYPKEALQKGQSGTVGVLAWIESDGRVATCQVIESSAAPVLEQATCNVIKRRARFTPAKDVAGNAVRSPVFTRIRWLLPSW